MVASRSSAKQPADEVHVELSELPAERLSLALMQPELP